MPNAKIRKNYKTRRNNNSSNNKNKQQSLVFQFEFKEEDFDECQICFGLIPNIVPDFGNQNMITNKPMTLLCGHKFHNNCIKDYLKYFGFSQMEKCITQQVHFNCPIEGCKQSLTLEDIAIALDVKDIQSWLQKMKTQIIFKCKLQYCQKTIVYHKDLNQDVVCPRCNISYDPKTQNFSNMDTENIDQLNNLKEQGFVKCYQCKFWIQKSEGCNHMTCTCNAEICYKCGGKYGQCYCFGVYNGEETGIQLSFLQR